MNKIEKYISLHHKAADQLNTALACKNLMLGEINPITKDVYISKYGKAINEYALTMQELIEKPVKKIFGED